MKFPSKEWCQAVAVAMLRDASVVAAIADFGPVVAGIVITGKPDFCVLARVEPGKAVKLSFPDDEDELEDLEPDYTAWVSYDLCRDLLQQTMQGKRPDPLRAILERKIRLKGDLERVVKHAGRHQGAGLDAIRAVPTEFV